MKESSFFFCFLPQALPVQYHGQDDVLAIQFQSLNKPSENLDKFKGFLSLQMIKDSTHTKRKYYLVWRQGYHHDDNKQHFVDIPGKYGEFTQCKTMFAIQVQLHTDFFNTFESLASLQRNMYADPILDVQVTVGWKTGFYLYSKLKPSLCPQMTKNTSLVCLNFSLPTFSSNSFIMLRKNQKPNAQNKSQRVTFADMWAYAQKYHGVPIAIPPFGYLPGCVPSLKKGMLLSWTEAFKMCRSVSGNLPSVASQTELHQIVSLIKFAVEILPTEGLYLGLVFSNIKVRSTIFNLK